MTKRAKKTDDVLELAYSIFSVAVGDEPSHPEEPTKDPQAVARGSKGGKTRAANLSSRKKRQIAKKAAAARWDRKS